MDFIPYNPDVKPKKRRAPKADFLAVDQRIQLPSNIAEDVNHPHAPHHTPHNTYDDYPMNDVISTPDPEPTAMEVEIEPVSFEDDDDDRPYLPPLHNLFTPEIDPNREIVDHNDSDEGSGEGAGAEEAQQDDIAASTTTTAKLRTSIPAHIQSKFQSHVERWMPHTSADRTPILYSLHTFWTPDEDSYLKNRQKHTSLSPSDYYGSRFLIWDILGLVERLPCSNTMCSGFLARRSNYERPRRVVDMSSCYWLIGARYYCKKCNKTCISWDNNILHYLETEHPDLAASFPAMLTHRSGMDKALIAFMASCFSSGMGAKQFSDALRERHTEAFEFKHLRYLQAVRSRANLLKQANVTLKPFGTFKDDYGGFVPSGSWLRDVWDNMIEAQRPIIEQHMAMLPINVIGIDHAHKAAARIANAMGTRIFTANMDMTTAFGEIRLSVFTSTKAHEAFEPSFSAVQNSATKYGLEGPEVAYTDNISDAPMLMRIFPSLTKGVVSADQWGHLPTLDFPQNDSVQVKVISGADAINEVIKSYIYHSDAIQPESIHVAMDTEWNVSLTQRGSATSGVSGRTAVITLAQRNKVDILQVAPFVNSSRLPSVLETFLSLPIVYKIGRAIKGDLSHLGREVNPAKPFCGSIDLAHMAHERKLVPNKNCSLSELCARILGQRLIKDPSIRTSTLWENSTLPEQHIHYAALDTWASWLIYEQLLEIPIPGPLSPTAAAGSPVALRTEDFTQVAAYGVLADRSLNGVGRVKVKQSQTVITVTDVLVPATLLTAHGKASLVSFGTPPFNIVCSKRLLQSHDPIDEIPPHAQDFAFPSEMNDDDVIEYQRLEAIHSVDLEGRGFHMSSAAQTNLTQDSEDPPPDLTTFEKDEGLAEEGKKMLGQIVPPAETGQIFSRVLKDPWHLMHQISLPANHGLRHSFSVTWRDILFVPDSDDKAAIDKYAIANGTTFEKLVQTKPQWVWRHCRRYIRPPSVIFPLVEKLFHDYGPLKDATAGTPLFNATAWKTAQGVLRTIRDGFVSDPPGVALYLQIGVDAEADNLPIYFCCCGTNISEGAVHRPMISIFPSNGVGVRHAIMALIAFVMRHNLKVGTRNRTGAPYLGHFNLPLMNHLHSLLSATERYIPGQDLRSGWINTTLYEPTEERVGIVPIPQQLLDAACIKPYDLHKIPIGKKIRHGFLARNQGAQFAVTPVHTDYEKELFGTLKRQLASFRDNHYVEGAKIWNEVYVDGEKCFYKFAEHLQSFMTTWSRNANIRATLMATTSERSEITQLVKHSAAANTNLKVPQFSRAPIPVPAPTVNANQGTLDEFIQGSSRSTHTTQDATKQRKKRTCRKCGGIMDVCKGAQNVENCKNACRDCGEKDCKGRDPRNFQSNRTCDRTGNRLIKKD